MADEITFDDFADLVGMGVEIVFDDSVGRVARVLRDEDVS
jgi:hypothetical protein